jgi:hypothetical protein
MRFIEKDDMTIKRILVFTLFTILFFPSSSTLTADRDSCQICHTNESMLKFLFKPPAMQASEGEG